MLTAQQIELQVHLIKVNIEIESIRQRIAEFVIASNGENDINNARIPLLMRISALLRSPVPGPEFADLHAEILKSYNEEMQAVLKEAWQSGYFDNVIGVSSEFVGSVAWRSGFNLYTYRILDQSEEVGLNFDIMLANAKGEVACNQLRLSTLQIRQSILHNIRQSLMYQIAEIEVLKSSQATPTLAPPNTPVTPLPFSRPATPEVAIAPVAVSQEFEKSLKDNYGVPPLTFSSAASCAVRRPSELPLPLSQNFMSDTDLDEMLVNKNKRKNPKS